MAIRNHYLIDSSSEANIVQAALAELVAQQARVVAAKAVTGNHYEMKRAVSLLVRIAEVHGAA